ncbi:TetR/AcrR family transcriptional regulator [Spelaeicoccus albus]|nr:TetR/AcrR family transcriptional regulator [Spelaeicoccus albus]
MPRLTAGNREARRAEIIAAARRCFSRDGFHRTSMPDIAAEAGVSTGAPYRYFASKEEIILQVAGDAFRVLLVPLEGLVESGEAVSPADLVTAAIEPAGWSQGVDAAGKIVPVDELFRCAVGAWAELLRHEDLRVSATRGFEEVRQQIASTLLRGQAAGTITDQINPDGASRVVMALLHGFILQRVAFGLEDLDGIRDDAMTILRGAGLLQT